MATNATRVETIDVTPRLPDDWREELAQCRKQGIPDSPRHRRAYQKFCEICFPRVDVSIPEAREQLEAWWVLTQLPYDGVWQHWLDASPGKRMSRG